jgi:hypothetical protein
MFRLRIAAVALLAVSLVAAASAIDKTAIPPSPELVGQLSQQLSITPAQATGGAGTLFGLAKSRLSPADFSKVAAAVPGMGGFLKAAPSTKSSGGLGSLTSGLPSEMGGLASAAGSFQKLGLSPNMISKFVPVLTHFVESKGGASAASLLSGALK